MIGFNPMPHPGLAKEYPQAYIVMGQTAENVARKWQVTRAEQEAFAVAQPQEGRGGAAGRQAQGRDRADQGARTASSIRTAAFVRRRPQKALAALKPAFDAEGTVTAGTSSPLTDGAAAVLVMTEDYAKRNQPADPGAPQEHRGRRLRAGDHGHRPGAGDAEGVETRRPSDQGHRHRRDSTRRSPRQAIACMRELGIDEKKANLDGGALALGHPLGATGARITGKAASLLAREGKRYALATQCIGGGQGIATVLERG